MPHVQEEKEQDEKLITLRIKVPAGAQVLDTKIDVNGRIVGYGRPDSNGLMEIPVPESLLKSKVKDGEYEITVSLLDPHGLQSLQNTITVSNIKRLIYLDLSSLFE